MSIVTCISIFNTVVTDVTDAILLLAYDPDLFCEPIQDVYIRLCNLHINYSCMLPPCNEMLVVAYEHETLKYEAQNRRSFCATLVALLFVPCEPEQIAKNLGQQNPYILPVQTAYLWIARSGLDCSRSPLPHGNTTDADNPTVKCSQLHVHEFVRTYKMCKSFRDKCPVI